MSMEHRDSLLYRLDEIAKYEANWDGANASKPSAVAIAVMRKIVERSAIDKLIDILIPCVDGGLELMSADNDYPFSIEVLPNGDIDVWYATRGKQSGSIVGSSLFAVRATEAEEEQSSEN